MLKVNVMELVIWLGVVGVLLTTAIAIFFEQHGILDLILWTTVEIQRSPMFAVAIVLILGLTSFLSQMCLYLAWQLETAPLVTMAQMYRLVAVEFLFQVMVEQEYLQVVPTIGVFLVFLAGFTVIISRFNRWEGF